MPPKTPSLTDFSGDPPACAAPERRIYSVGELNRAAKALLEKAFPYVFVQGEISNFTVHGSGHWYFAIKDEASVQIRVVMFRGMNANVKFEVKDGQKVIIGGSISLYETQGQYQLLARTIEPAGLGNLQLAFLQLKDKLQKEGLFDPSKKRPIPFLPARVGIVTSPTGAVIRDIINISQRRFPGLPMLLYPARVQGDGAKDEICEGIRVLNTIPDVEVIIVARGGGSLEDLWAFNEECVARAIRASGVPVISAVGHETDITISDFASDCRAPTPSAAAEMVAPVKADLYSNILDVRKRAYVGATNQLKQYGDLLARVMRSRAFTRPSDVIDERAQRIDELLGRSAVSARLEINRLRSTFADRIKRLESVNPLAVLGRGYSIATDDKGDVVKSIKNVKTGAVMHSRVKDGKIVSKVTGVEKI